MTNTLDALIKQIQSDDTSTRLKAIRALGHYQDNTDVLAILENLLDDASVTIVRTSILVLGRIGGCEQLTNIVPLLDHDSLWIQKASVQAIGLLGCAEVVPILVRLLDNEALHDLSREALVALKVDPDFF